MTIELRAPKLEEAAAIAELANRASDELFGEREETEVTTRMWLTTPDLELNEDFRVAVQDRRIVGYADLGAHPEPKFWLDLRVPMSGEDEIRDALIEWGEERARARNGELVRGFAWEPDQPAKEALSRHGYELIRHSYRMRIDFGADLPEPEWPEGITVRPADERDTRAAYAAHQESFLDSWEPGEESFEEWKHWMVEEGIDLSLWFLAEEHGELAGVALCQPHDVEEGLGWVRVLGVRRAWRRRGLGRALLLHAFHEFRRRGSHAVGLGVDAESLTGAVRLYEQAGMKVSRRSDIYEKRLS